MLLGGKPTTLTQDLGGCGKRLPTSLRLCSTPRVWTVAVVWDTAAASEAEMADVCEPLMTSLDVRNVYDGAQRSFSFALCRQA